MRYPKPRLFRPKNPKKYMGDPTNIVARSGLEAKFFRFFDETDSVVKYSSEEMFVPYISPIDNKLHRYFVDVLFETKDGKKYMAEIKPHSQTLEPKRPKTKKGNANFLKESITYEINNAKWTAATKFCKEKGITFIFLTELNLPRALR